jgi:purine nucleosidase
VTICTIGPVTNVAAFFAARPDLLDRVARIQAMGGCLAPFEADGTAGSPFEFNASCDPLALAALFALPVQLGVVPLDVTIGAVLSDADRAEIAGTGRLGSVLGVLMENFTAMLGRVMPKAAPKVRLHDPLAVAALVEPRIARFEPALAATFGTPGACRTVVSPNGRPVDACRGVDAPALAALVVRTLTAPRAGAR